MSATYYPAHGSLPVAQLVVLHPADTTLIEALLRALKESVAREQRRTS